MNKLAPFSLILTLLSSGMALAQANPSRPFGLGLSVGEPAGLTAKFWNNRHSAFDAAIGYGFFPTNGVAIYADYLHTLDTLIDNSRTPFDLLLYVGIGGKVGFWSYEENGQEMSGVAVGVRFPFGLSMLFAKAPFELFLELTPSIAFLVPDPVWFDFDACLGFRYYF
jgi:hypothetical protein